LVECIDSCIEVSAQNIANSLCASTDFHGIVDNQVRRIERAKFSE